MDLRKKFGGDRAMEVDGVDLHLGGDAYITIARAGGTNVAYARAVQKYLRPIRKRDRFESEDLDLEEYADVQRQAFADTIVLGWRGIELDGAPLPFTRDNALRLMRDLPDLWEVVKAHAEKLANFQREDVEEMGKASPAT